MRPGVPPLNALRAFDAAARHESFVRAASELGVTPGAVAQQVKALEVWAGCVLFDRKPHGVQLTAEARTVMPKVEAAFDAIGLAATALRRSAAPARIRIAALPSVAQLWLSPRLPALHAAFPELTISVSHRPNAPNLSREPYDVALFFVASAGEGDTATVLATDALFPVCSPKIADRLQTIADLRGETLLHDERWCEDWRRWLAAVGERRVDARSGPTFSLYSLALQEAMEGAGVLIGHAPLVERSLARGDLVVPFGQRVRSEARLCALMSRERLRVDPAKRLVEWLVRSAASGAATHQDLASTARL
ncbi:MAG: LysR family transcriptional regulator [Proteobacteria bacterium]|nr:LysR family transcriptional regulator [Pseudomonadota bacterium]MBI3497292.1 LysR family transcriptional regulator [Pseudomonadota bacterium]